MNALPKELRGGQAYEEPTPDPSLQGGELNFTEFLDAFGVQKLQKKDFPALEGGAPKAGWVKDTCPPLNPKGRGE